MSYDELTINGLVPGAGRCVADGCGASIAGGYLMCGRHWSRVDLHLAAELQHAVDRWRGGVGTLGELRDVQRACVESLRDASTDGAPL
ncbi:MAG: hypothetical protein KY469_10610 [Actinobacteria bacterium]|nr:hypothetical protein [Actinomycetota bacterium]